MTDNPSFVLRAIEEVAYEERPVPESKLVRPTVLIHTLKYPAIQVSGDEVLVEVKKTGK